MSPLSVFLRLCLLLVVSGLLLSCQNVQEALPKPEDFMPTESVALLTVDDDGTLLYRKQPWRGIGVNYWDAFSRSVSQGHGQHLASGFATLAQYKIPFARVMASPRYASDFTLYQKYPERYFQLLDEVVRQAEENQVGLVLTLFWNYHTVPDLVWEPIGHWGDAQSRTIAWMKQYTEEVVSRYQHSPAIWAWEFGHAYNELASLPDPQKQRQKSVLPEKGTPAQRSEQDDLTYDHLQVAWREFAQVVQQFDGERFIATGSGLPRAQAYHNWTEGSWEKDNQEQFRYMLSMSNPVPYQAISVHLYPWVAHQYPFASAEGSDGLCQLMRQASHLAKQNQQFLWVGAFGVPQDYRDGNIPQMFEDMLACLEKEASMAAVWAFDAAETDAALWDVSPTSHYAFMLPLLRLANDRMNGGVSLIPPVSKKAESPEKASPATKQ